jgi:endonuclease YncB( thermonuclease family)
MNFLAGLFLGVLLGAGGIVIVFRKLLKGIEITVRNPTDSDKRLLGMGFMVLSIMCLTPAGFGADLPVSTIQGYTVSVTDGDTLKVWVPTIVRVDPETVSITLRHYKVRMKGWDAWESARYRRTVYITPEEIEKGKAATEHLKDLIRGQELRVVTEFKGAVGDRIEGVLMRKNKTTRQWEDVSKLMAAAGHTRKPHPLDGKKRWGQ